MLSLMDVANSFRDKFCDYAGQSVCTNLSKYSHGLSNPVVLATISSIAAGVIIYRKWNATTNPSSNNERILDRQIVKSGPSKESLVSSGEKRRDMEQRAKVQNSDDREENLESSSESLVNSQEELPFLQPANQAPIYFPNGTTIDRRSQEISYMDDDKYFESNPEDLKHFELRAKIEGYPVYRFRCCLIEEFNLNLMLSFKGERLIPKMDPRLTFEDGSPIPNPVSSVATVTLYLENGCLLPRNETWAQQRSRSKRPIIDNDLTSIRSITFTFPESLLKSWEEEKNLRLRYDGILVELSWDGSR